MGQSKTYFASDFHLGVSGSMEHVEREKRIVEWMHYVSQDATTIYLVGDIFDYWYEYKEVIPRGYSRFFAALRYVVDKGIDVQFFTGNHDVWMYTYFTEEFGIPVHKKPLEITIDGKRLLIGHGDGLGPGDKGYKRMKKVFTNPLCQWLWSRFHPNFALNVMQNFSSTSRKFDNESDHFLGEKEWLVQYSERKQAEQKRDYYVFGHRHIPIDYRLSDGHGRYINLGDWLHHYSYAVLEDGMMSLKYFNE